MGKILLDWMIHDCDHVALKPKAEVMINVTLN